MTKLRLTWLGILLAVLAVCGLVGAVFVSGPIGARVAIGVLSLIVAPAAWRCLLVAARRPDESWPPVPRPWER